MLYLSTPSTSDPEEGRPEVFLDAASLANHLITVAGDIGETLTNALDQEIEPTVKAVKDVLESNQTVYVGDFTEVGESIEPSLSRESSALALLLSCDGITVDRSWFVRYLSIEMEETVKDCIVCLETGNTERLTSLREQYGNDPVFSYNDGKNAIEMTLNMLLDSTRHPDKPEEWLMTDSWGEVFNIEFHRLLTL